MNINIVKKQPGSWRGQNRRSLALFVRTNARDWDGLFELADDTGTPVKRIVREALHEYIARHQQRRSEVRITVSGTDGTQVLQKIKHLFGG